MTWARGASCGVIGGHRRALPRTTRSWIALAFRTAEVNMGDDTPFDRTEDALEVVARHEGGARIFATLMRMADDLGPIAKDVSVLSSDTESCACAALYADLRGTKAAFELKE